jgi:L-iditol 2-dehydrogenase
MMRAAVLVEPPRIELQTCERPSPGVGAVVVRVRAALTDGTDLKAYRRGHPKMPMPTRFGHEFSGDVAAVGNGVTAFSPGDAIMSVHSAPCGGCYWCVHGEEELCESIMATMILGAYAEYIEVPARIVSRNAYLKPNDVSYTAAAFLEPIACVVHSVEMLNARKEDTVLVIGDGGFGLLHALVLQQWGAAPILAGRRSERLDLARRLGIKRIVDARSGALDEAVRAQTAGRGADALIECTGREEVWQQAPALVRRGGIVSFFGGLPPQVRVSFDAARLHYDQVRLLSPFHFGTHAVRRAYELLASHAVEPEALVTERFALQRIGEAFERLDRGEGIKFAIEP